MTAAIGEVVMERNPGLSSFSSSSGGRFWSLAMVQNGALVAVRNSQRSKHLTQIFRSRVQQGAESVMFSRSSLAAPDEKKIFVLRRPTLHPWAEMILRSAGILSPPLTSTRSPTTTSSALMCFFSPSRTTRACCVTRHSPRLKTGRINTLVPRN